MFCCDLLQKSYFIRLIFGVRPMEGFGPIEETRISWRVNSNDSSQIYGIANIASNADLFLRKLNNLLTSNSREQTKLK